MKKIITTLALAGMALASWAQNGIHMQNGTQYQSFFYNKDSVYIGVSNQGSGNFRRMCLVNPATKDWVYTNPVDFTGYLGPFVMKNNKQGVMYDQGNGNMYYTGDGWQTRQTISGLTTLNQLGLSNSGYVGYNSTIHKLYYSADGQTWNLTASVPTPGSGGIKLAALNNKVVLFYQYASAYVSTDGGQTYNTVSYNNSFSGTFIDFMMYTQDTMYALTSTSLYKTYDNGVTWTSAPAPTPLVNSIRGMLVKNPNEIYAWDGGKNVFYTSNAGTTWQTKTPIIPLGNFEKMVVIDTDIYAWPDCKSSDGCNTWQPVLPGSQVTYAKGTDIHFKGNLGISTSTTGRYSISHDKGRSFTVTDTIPGAGDLTAVKILDNGHFIAVDSKGQVFYSTNNGATWVKNYSNNTNVNTFKITNSVNDNTILLTRSLYPLVSTDHGTTWTVVTTNGGSHSQTLKPNGDIIDVVGWFNYTTLQEQGWQMSKYNVSGSSTVIDTFLASNESLIDIHCTSNNRGYLFTTDNSSKVTKVYKTTNGFTGGTTLVSTIPVVTSGVANYALSKLRIQNFGDDTLFLLGDGNTYYHYSYDGGATWNLVNETFCTTYSNNYSALRKGYFFNKDEYVFTLYSGGWYLNVVSAGGFTNGIQMHKDDMVSLDNIKAYPNPCATSLYLDTDKNINHVLLYNIIGEKVADLKNTHLLDVSNLPTGVYMLKVLTNHNQWHQQKVIVSH